MSNNQSQSQYSYCRLNGTRRVTKNGITREEKCDTSWKPWQLKQKDVKGYCGCATCSYEYVCPENDCGPRDDLNFEISCNFQLCKDSSEPNPSPKFVRIINQTSYQLYVILQGNPAQHYVLKSSEQAGYGFEERLNINVGTIGNLNSNDFFAATPAGIVKQSTLIQGIMYLDSKIEYLQVDFVDKKLPCELKTTDNNNNEAKLLAPIQLDLNKFLQSKTLDELNTFLHNATVYFVKDKQYYQSESISGDRVGFKLQSGLAPEKFTWTTAIGGEMKLISQNTTPARVCGSGICSNIFVLAYNAPTPTILKNPLLLQTQISLIPIISNSKKAIGYGRLPFTLAELSPGLDNVTMIIEKLSTEGRNAFLDSSTVAKQQCCDLNYYANFGLSVCDNSKFSARDQKYTNCDEFVDEYCKAPLLDEPNRVNFCSCYSSAPILDPIQKQIIETLEAKGHPIPRKCLVKQCREGIGYQNAAIRKEDCPGLCLQIQQIINNGDLSNIDFKGIQTLQCGDEYFKLPSSISNSNYFFIAAGSVLLVGILLVLIFQKLKYNVPNGYYALPISIAVILVTFGLLYFFGIL